MNALDKRILSEFWKAKNISPNLLGVKFGGPCVFQITIVI